MKRTRYLLLFILLFTLQTYANETTFRFRHYTVEDGFSSNSIRSILQDYTGYIWVGTENGLNRFDGIQIKDYSKATPSYPGNAAVTALFQEADSTIWIGTDIGIFYYLPGKDSFQPLPVKTPNGITPSTTVYSICTDRESRIWFSTYGQGIFRYNKATNELIQYPILDCYNNVYKVYIDKDQNIWASGNLTSSAAFYKLNRNVDKFESFPLKYPQGDRFSNALSIFEDSSRNLWLGTRENGIQKVDKYTGEVQTYLSPAMGEGIMHIHSIAEYSHETLLIGSDDGLIMFNTITGGHIAFVPEETNPYSISNQFIYPIVKDKEGGIWIGTYYGGVNYVSPRNGQFESFVYTKYANSVSGSIISCFNEDKSGNIWIGSDDGGLSKYSPATGRFVNYMPQEGKNSLSYHNIHALCFDDDNLWIGTYSGGLNVMNTKTGVFKHYQSSDDIHSLDQNSIYAILKDRDANIWVTSMTGVNLYNRENDNFYRIKEFGYVTMDIKQDTKGDLWFATQGKGVFKYNTVTQSWKNYTNSPAKGSLISNMVNCVHVDSHGEILIGTTNGLCKYNPATDSFDEITLDIPNRNICAIIEENHRFWITTGKGLVYYIPGEGVTVFTQSDGLVSDLFLPTAALKASDGKIYLGSVNGFNTFYPYNIRKNEFVPPVVFTGLEIFNKEIPVDANGILHAPIDKIQRLDLSHKDKVFNISFAGLSYSIPERNQYAYKLEGFDKDWNYVGMQNKATYTGLPAGNYTLKVKAANNDGVWNETGTNLEIVIHPPFYLSAGFKVLYGFLFIIGLSIFFRLLINRTEKKHIKEIEALNQRKEKEMHEAKISFFTMIAHEIRTPVSLIIGPLEKILSIHKNEIPASIQSDLNVIDRNSQRLLFLVNQLLDFRKVERDGVSLKLEKCSITEVIKAVSIRFEPWVTQRGAEFIVEYPEHDRIATIDKEAVTKLLSNLLTNASKYTKDKVKLRCEFNDAENNFTISVTDNGCGIAENDLSKIFQPFFQAAENKPGTGIGLSIVKSIVDAHQGKISVDSEAGKGSTFKITLPMELEINEYSPETGEENVSFYPEDILSGMVTEPETSQKPSMLIVDDNDEMLNFLSTSFSDEYTIITAEDGAEALAKLKENNVSLIISDWMMPKMNGIELCKAVRSCQTLSHIPFIMLTAKSDVHSKIEGMDCGADIYIEKPFSLQYLKSCIRNLIDLREMLYQKFSKMPLVPLKSIAPNHADEQFLSKMNRIIEDNFSNPDLSVDFLADKLCISRSGLFAKIKTLANVTPNELIQVVRLKKAAVLLAENKYRINEISYMVGFNNPSYFSKCFQKQFGMKPGEFLKNENKEIPNIGS